MALVGTLIGPAVRLATDGRGLPILASDEPEVPEGFKAVMAYEQRGGSIYQVWSVVPTGCAMTRCGLLPCPPRLSVTRTC